MTSLRLIQAIEAGTVDRLPAGTRAEVDGGRVGDTCRVIAASVEAEQRRVVEALLNCSVAVTPRAVPALRQRHEFVVSIDRADAPLAAATLVEQLGYRRHPEWTAGADRSFWATAHEVALTRTDATTFVARLRWATPRPTSLPARLFRPTPADWATVALPTWGWRAYGIVRPLRLLRERLGDPPDHASLEPFLATPTSLIGPLLDVAEVDAHDVIADIGCGDGRIVVAAAERHGCRAIGFEFDAGLVDAARRRVAAAGLDAHVTVVQGDGLASDLSGVSVAMLFVPPTVAARAVPVLLRRLPRGARIVLHEQSRLSTDLPEPDRSEPIITADAVTVARRWTVA